MQQQLNVSEQQVEQLSAQVEALKAALLARESGASTSSADAASRLQSAVSDLKDEQDVLQAEIKQHEQTKIETASKYPLRITGLLLFSSFLNNGAVDNIDGPILAYKTAKGDPGGSFASTFRQSILGLDATGPSIWGAKSSADLNIDFFGGLAYADYNTSAGIIRLRTAHARLAWPEHSIDLALDAPLISPLSPTSFLSVGEPALAWSGNLWAWSPQLESQNHVNFAKATIHYDFALIDPSAPGPPPASGLRQPDASEQSRQPGYEIHSSYTKHLADREFELGGGVYYSRQAYSTKQHVDAWTASADWKLPVSEHLELSGEFYRGRAVGGLGGGGFKDIVTDPVTGTIHGLDDEGGWAQAKLHISPAFELNAAFGQDNPFANQLYDSSASAATDPYSTLAKNRTATANIIFRPKTYLLFSAEFRYLQSWPIYGSANTAPVVGLGAGYLF